MEVVINNPNYLWALLIIPILIISYFASLRSSKKLALKFSNFVALAKLSGGLGEVRNLRVLFLRIFAIVFLVLSIAGVNIWYFGQTNDRSYVIAIDASSSMTISDVGLSRLELAKKEAISFLDNIPQGAKVGVVSFSGVSFIKQYLTDDLNKVKEGINSITPLTIGGTDLGSVLITSTNILIDSKKPRRVILITDGRSNVGVPVDLGIHYANKNHVIVDTIGVGIQTKVNDNLELGLDASELIKIANKTSGKYYHVSTVEELKKAYSEIALSKNYDKKVFDLTPIFLFLTLIFVLLDWLFEEMFYRVIP